MRAAALAALLVLVGCAGNQRPAAMWRESASVSAHDRFAARVDAARQQFDDGLYDQARVTVDALIADGATHALVPLLRARLAERDADWPTCIDWSRRAVEASPGWGEPRVLLARACLEAGRVADADAAFADVDRLVPDSAWGPYGRAWVAARRLDVVHGAELADEALRREPEHRPALLLRAELARLQGDAVREEACLQRADAIGDPDAGVIARLAALADTAGRQIDAARLYERAWELAPLPETARRRLELARRAGDAVGERLWAARAGRP